MDQREEDEQIKTSNRTVSDSKRPLRLRVAIRWLITLLLSILASFVFSFLLGLAALAIGNRSSSAVSVPSTCKILSSSVDIRNSKVCKLGLLNYKTKHVIYPSDKRRFRCQDDYYWASIFQVEYKEYFSGQTYQAIAEAPKEALPIYCRPNFNTAWLTKLKFKVNETYNCRYTLGNWKADIYSDNKLFNCQAEDPSILELIRRLCILFIQSYISESNFKVRELLGYVLGGIIAGIAGGFFTSLSAAFLQKSVNKMILSIYNKHHLKALMARLKFICLLTLYLSAFGWFIIHYLRFIGLKQLVLESRLKHWLV